MTDQPDVFQGRFGTPGGPGYIGYYEVDRHGRLQPRADVRGMLAPVRCGHCGAVYDLADVEVTGAMPTAPCGRRPAAAGRWTTGTWKSLPDIIQLDGNGRPI